MSLVDQFLSGAQRVTIEVTYFRPRQVGQDSLTIQPTLLGKSATKLNHSGILQTFVTQKDDQSDLEDARLKKVFEELVLMRGGLVHVHDRRLRMGMMTNFETAAIMPIIIPKPNEVQNSGMAEAVQVFKTMVPFPEVRKFLQYWQDEIEGPMRQVRLAVGSISKSDVVQKHVRVLH